MTRRISWLNLGKIWIVGEIKSYSWREAYLGSHAKFAFDTLVYVPAGRVVIECIAGAATGLT